MTTDNTGACRFRNAEAADIPCVLSIEEESSGRWQREHFTRELETSFSRFIVALLDDQIVGYAVAWNVTGEIQLNNIAVHPGFRRRGIGRMIVEHIVELHARFNPEKILLEVNEKNTAARSFYARLGFTVTGVRKKYYAGDDALLMEKLITATQDRDENKKSIFP